MSILFIVLGVVFVWREKVIHSTKRRIVLARRCNCRANDVLSFMRIARGDL